APGPSARTEKLDRLLEVHFELVHRAPVQLASHRAQSDPSKWPILIRPLVAYFDRPLTMTRGIVGFRPRDAAFDGDRVEVGRDHAAGDDGIVARGDRGEIGVLGVADGHGSGGVLEETIQWKPRMDTDQKRLRR